MERPTFIVYGVTSNKSVDLTVKGLTKRGYQVFVIIDAIKEIPTLPITTEEWVESGVKLVTTEQITNKQTV